MSDQLRFGISIDADTSGFGANVSKAEQAFTRFLESLGKTPDEIRAFGEAAAAVDTARTSMESFDAETRKLLSDYQSLRSVAQAKDILGLIPESELKARIDVVRNAFEQLKASGTLSEGDLAQAAARMTEQVRALEAQMKSAGSSFEQAMSKLDIRETATIEGEIAAIRGAYETLAASGRLTEQDLNRASASMESKLSALASEARGAGAVFDQALEKLGVPNQAQVEGEIASLRAAYKTLADSGRLSTEELDRAHGNLLRSIANLRGETENEGADIKRLGNAAQEARGGFSSLKTSISSIGFAAWNTIFQGAMNMVAGLGQKVKDLAASFLTTSSTFEDFGTQLVTITGSSAKAQTALAWITEFARTTPYELADVTEAFIRLKSKGVDPMDGSLRVVGDAASSMNKTMGQAVEALGDAMMGEGERLKEFMIDQQLAGDKVAYHWTDKMGQARTSVTQNTPAMIKETLLAIWNEQYAGGMDRMSRTWSGMWSNLKDTVTLWKKAVMDSGPFQMLKDWITDALDWLDKLRANGSMKEWAEDAGAAILSVVKATSALLSPIKDFVSGAIEQFGRYQGALANVRDATGEIKPPETTLWSDLWSFLKEWGANTIAVFQLVARSAGSLFSSMVVEFKNDIETLWELSKAGGQLMVDGLTLHWGKIPREWDNVVTLIAQHNQKMLANGQALTSGMSAAWDAFVRETTERGIPALVKATAAASEAVKKPVADASSAVMSYADIVKAADQAGKQLGVDIDKAMTGVSGATLDAAKNFTAIVNALDFSRMSAEDVRRFFEGPWITTLKKATDPADVEFLAQMLQFMGEGGKLAGEQIATGMALAKQRLAELQPDAEALKKTWDELLKVGEEGFRKEAAAAAEYSKAQDEAVAKSEVAAIKAGDHWLALQKGIDDSGEKVVEFQGTVENLTDAFPQLAGASAEAKQAFADLFNAAERDAVEASAAVGGLGYALFDAGQMAQQVADRFKTQSDAVNTLIKRLEAGTVSINEAEVAAGNATRSFDLLGQEQLLSLRQALADARQRTVALEDSARSTLRALQDEFDQLNNNQLAIENRRYQAQKDDLQAQLEVAQKAKDTQAISDLRGAERLADQIHAKKMQQIRDEAAAQRAAQQQAAQDALDARKAEMNQREGISTPTASSNAREADSANRTGEFSTRVSTTKTVKIDFGNGISGDFDESSAQQFVQLLRSKGLVTGAY